MDHAPLLVYGFGSRFIGARRGSQGARPRWPGAEGAGRNNVTRETFRPARPPPPRRLAVAAYKDILALHIENKKQ